MNLHIKKKFIILTLVITLGTNCVYAVENISVEKNAILNIKDCIELALHNSPSVKKAKYNYGLAKNNVTISKSAYFPTIGVGTGYYATQNATSNSLMRNGNMNYYSAEASIQQLIFDFGKTFADVKMNKFDMITAIYEFD